MVGLRAIPRSAGCTQYRPSAVGFLEVGGFEALLLISSSLHLDQEQLPATEVRYDPGGLKYGSQEIY